MHRSSLRLLPLVPLALLGALAACRWDTDDIATRAQGWSGNERGAWYWGTQGSRLMPVAWFNALEQAGSTEPFSAMDNLTSFGFLSPPDASPSTLPIGFAHDQQPDTAFRVTGLR